MPDLIPVSRPFIGGKELFDLATAALAGRQAGQPVYSGRGEAWPREDSAAPRAILTHTCAAAIETAGDSAPKNVFQASARLEHELKAHRPHAGFDIGAEVGTP